MAITIPENGTAPFYIRCAEKSQFINIFPGETMFADTADRIAVLAQRMIRYLTGRDIDPASVRNLLLFSSAVAAVFYIQVIVTPLTGFDNYTYFLGTHGDRLFEVFRGIWMFALENTLFPSLGKAPVVSSLGFLSITILTCSISIAFWSESSSLSWPDYMAALIFITFPYWLSQLYFPYYHFGYALSTFLCVCAAALAWSGTGFIKPGLSVLCFVAGVGFYQGTVGVAASLLAAGTLLSITRRILNGDSILPVLRRCFRAGLILAIGAAVYMLAHKAILSLSGLDLWETKSYSVVFDTDIKARMWTLRRALTGSPFLLPGNISWVFPALAAGVSGLCFFRAVKEKKPLLAAVPVILAGVIFSPVVLVLVQRHNLFPRSMVGAAFVWSALFLLAVRLCRERGKPLFIAGAIVVALAFAIRVNYAWNIQKLTNDADRITAGLIWQRVASLPESAAIPRPLSVSLIGCIPPEKQPWPADKESMFGNSQLTCFGHSVLLAHAASLFRFAGAELKVVPTLPDDASRVKDRAPWPADDSVFYDDQGIAVWLGGPLESSMQAFRPDMVALAQAFGIQDPLLESRFLPKLLPSDAWLAGLVKSGPGPWQAPADLYKAKGKVEKIIPLPGKAAFSRVEGWSFDLMHKTVPDRIIIMDAQGKIIGFAATGIARPDLSRKIGPDSYYSGFNGYILNNANPAGFFYVSGYDL